MAIFGITRDSKAYESEDKYVISYLKTTVRLFGVPVYNSYSNSKNEFTFEEKNKRINGEQVKSLGFNTGNKHGVKNT